MRIPLSTPDMGARERTLILEAFDSGYVGPVGPWLERFEQAFAEAVGARRALAVSSGTAALHLALRAIGVGAGDRVAVPTLTFIGGVAPVLYQQARPVFVDCRADDLGMDPQRLEEALAAAHGDSEPIRAVVPADLYGQACDHDGLRAVCERWGAELVLDSAEAVGALYHGRPPGGRARAAVWSFNGNKIITTGGGGMLTSDDAALIGRARGLATAARLPAVHYEHAEVGYNYRMGSLQAALGLAQLESLEAKVARRRAIFERYRIGLSDLGGLAFAPEVEGRRHTRWLSVVRIDPARFGRDREAVRLALEAVEIEARPVWKPMHLQPAFRGAPLFGGAVAEAVFADGLCLPSGSALTDEMIDEVIGAIRALA